MSHENSRIRTVILSATCTVVALLVFYGSSIPRPGVALPDPGTDVEHILTIDAELEALRSEVKRCLRPEGGGV